MAIPDEFLKPESMLTPGIAGGTAMMIANTLRMQFGLEPRCTALLLSFLIGSIVFSAKALSTWQRGVYWLLNSLVIFSIATGVNDIASSASTSVAPTSTAQREVTFIEWLVSPSSAQADTQTASERPGKPVKPGPRTSRIRPLPGRAPKSVGHSPAPRMVVQDGSDQPPLTSLSEEDLAREAARLAREAKSVGRDLAVISAEAEKAREDGSAVPKDLLLAERRALRRQTEVKGRSADVASELLRRKQRELEKLAELQRRQQQTASKERPQAAWKRFFAPW